MLLKRRKSTPYPPRWIYICVLCWLSKSALGKLESPSIVNQKFSQQPHAEGGFKPIISNEPHIFGTQENEIFGDGKFDLSTFDIDKSQHSKKRSGVIYIPMDIAPSAPVFAKPVTRRPLKPVAATTKRHRFSNRLNATRNELPLEQLEKVILRYIKETLNIRRSYELFPGLRIEADNSTRTTPGSFTGDTARSIDSAPTSSNHVSLEREVTNQVRKFAEGHVVNLNIPRALETGRLFFFKGLKKILWPVFIGIQIAKTILLALFLPSILWSFRKIVGKGLSQVSGYNSPSETVADLDFRDNTYNFDQDSTGLNDFMFQQPEPSPTSMMQHNSNHNNDNSNFATQMYDAAATNNALSRFGFGDQKATYVNTGNAIPVSKNSANSIFSTKMHDFKVFHDIPASSLLLTNYDPFYSPLLSRLDAIFMQLGLNPTPDQCRERLVCLMYASPAKYAPYSNLVSAQLSRELNELRKPISDNPDILRFFKYMKAAKDGQEGINCQKMYSECTHFKDHQNPAMITTYNDINKLVHARKLQ